MKSKLKVKNGKLGILVSFLLTGVTGNISILQANPEERITNAGDVTINRREKQVARAKKILDGALFEAVNQGNLKGVTFLVEGGADPTAEDRCDRTPLNLAERLAERNPEEPERQAIVDFFYNSEKEQYATDDATIVATAQEIWGLNGGGFKEFIKAGKAIVETVVKAAKSEVKNAKSEAIDKAVKPKIVKAVESGSKAVKETVPKPVAKLVPESDRIVNTLADCVKYIEDKISKGICEKYKTIGDKRYYKVTKNHGELKKGDLLTQDNRHYEWELFNARGKHKGAIDPQKGTIYKPADPARHINVK
ncbi:MAG: hypothetical protein LBJ13_02915 [Puniceicoccales bacterium]|nr:hypothetical protein [Puniceicoccales bacterium]